MRAHRAVPVRPIRQRLVELKRPAHRQMPHRVAPRRRHRRCPRGPLRGLVQKRRARDDVWVREGESVRDECAQRGACRCVREDAAGDEARPDGVLGTDRLLERPSEVQGSFCMRSAARNGARGEDVRPRR